MAVLLMFMLACIFTVSCTKSPLKGWKYQPYENRPPSWENDMGRPDSDGGEEPFS